MTIKTFITLISFTLFIHNAHSHSGRTIEKGKLKGCHNHNKSQSFHCHSKSNFNLRGKNFLSKIEAEQFLGGIKEQIATDEKQYSRKEFKHWTDDDKNCLDTRAEVLKIRSLVEVNISNCRVVNGLWNDYYYREELSKASDIDIDHIVPLKDAWISGASKWTSKKREEFANDYENLVITNLKYNRRKGAKTPLEWLPVNKNYACKYIAKWILIKEKYELRISPLLIDQYRDMNCQ
ncbi:HNH endonuclease family protein [Halobacteriovorax sp.]|uniref:HNH endonuclease family protein n=1 Tax=Halobacteriovorax sp. TaxID=2020862 RepID=UPI003566A6B1